jgi:hypothetical protein
MRGWAVLAVVLLTVVGCSAAPPRPGTSRELAERQPRKPPPTADADVPPLRVANWNILHLGQHKKDLALAAQVI